MKLEDFLPNEYKEGYRFVRKEEDKNYKLVVLYNDEKNTTKLLILDKNSMYLSYFEMDYDLFRTEVLKCEKS